MNGILVCGSRAVTKKRRKQVREQVQFSAYCIKSLPLGLERENALKKRRRSRKKIELGRYRRGCSDRTGFTLFTDTAAGRPIWYLIYT